MPDQPDLFNGPDDNAALGRALGEAGMERVATHSAKEWFPHAQQAVYRICQLYPGLRCTGESLGRAVTKFYCAAPSPNAWGSLTKWAINEGLITATGDRRRMVKPRSHGRMTDVYYIVKR